LIRRARDDSRAVDSHLDIPVPDGLSLFPYQKAGVEYIINKFKANHLVGGVLLADEMGL